MTLAARLDVALRVAGLAITGVSIGDETDRTTWRVHPRELQAQAQPLIDAFVVPNASQLLDEQAISEVDEKRLKAIVMAIWELWPNPTMTRVQLRNRIITIYKSL